MTHALYLEDYMLWQNSSIGESNVWMEKPTLDGTILYSFITPCICLFGICGNILSMIVLYKPQFNSSIYTYLFATDLANSIFLFASGLFRGILWNYGRYAAYDALILLPIGGAVSCLNVVATVAVTIDRVIFLWNPVSLRKPKCCTRKVARHSMIISGILSVLMNVPYCFIYTWNHDGTLSTTNFFDSKFYMVHNWIKIAIYCIIPAIVLPIANGLLILAVHKALKLRQMSTVNYGRKLKRNKWKDQISLTITLVAIVFFFLIGDVLTQFVSRKTASIILFGGDEIAAAKSKELEIARQIFTVLNAINIAINFILYCLLFPPFRRALKSVFVKGPKIKPKRLQVNIFFISSHRTDILPLQEWFMSAKVNNFQTFIN